MEIDSPEPEAPRTTAAAAAAASDDSDPIIASYPVFANPPPASTRKLLILQHPNKQGPLRDAYGTLSEVRIKPGSGMIEVDVPISNHDGTYDREKGMKWGQALQRSMNQKNGGSHGLAGGFGVGVPAARAGRRREEDREIYDWAEAVRRDQVLRTQTLGGQYQGRNTVGESECRWMVGVFKGGNLHLTPANSEIQLRPQLHHLDAVSEQERLTRPGGGPGGLGGKDGAAAGPAAAPKAITMTIKSSSNGDETTTETMADRLRQVQIEGWQKLKYVHEDDHDAWELFHNTLVYHGPEAADSKDLKGKGKEVATEAKDVSQDSAAQLRSKWVEEDFLRAVAGKSRESVLEDGSAVLPGAKPEDVEDIKKEGAAGGVRRPAAAVAAKGKAAATTARRAPAKGR